MSAPSKKGSDGANDPNNKKGSDKPPAGEGMKKFLVKPVEEKGQYIAYTGPAGPGTLTVTTVPIESIPPQMSEKGKGKEKVATAATGGGFTFPPKSMTTRQVPGPIPPYTGDQSTKQSKIKRSTTKYSTRPKKPASGSFSEQSESSSEGRSVATTAAYSEPLMPGETGGREFRDGNNEVAIAIRGGRFVKTKLIVDGVPQTGHQYSAFMLYPGQGGTFGYSNVFRNEKGENVHINGSRKNATECGSIADKSKVKHLLFYGEGIQMIGTSGCVSCLGVYFELSKNRLFCAHINALNHDGTQHRPPLQRKSRDYFQMKEMFNRRLRAVSNRDGWSPKDYLPGTLTLVCPNEELAAYAVAEAINEFLGTSVEVEDAPGFVFTPGFSTGPQGPLGTIQLKSMTIGDWRSYESIPEEVKRIMEDGTHGRGALQPWTYISGDGPRSGWSWIGYNDKSWLRRYANNRIDAAEVPGLLSAR